MLLLPCFALPRCLSVTRPPLSLWLRLRKRCLHCRWFVVACHTTRHLHPQQQQHRLWQQPHSCSVLFCPPPHYPRSCSRWHHLHHPSHTPPPSLPPFTCLRTSCRNNLWKAAAAPKLQVSATPVFLPLHLWHILRITCRQHGIQSHHLRCPQRHQQLQLPEYSFRRPCLTYSHLFPAR